MNIKSTNRKNINSECFECLPRRLFENFQLVLVHQSKLTPRFKISEDGQTEGITNMLSSKLAHGRATTETHARADGNVIGNVSLNFHW